ncbi:hypothetical protein HYH03_006575 [Edaphochlamys debaryana]|uniref:Uncharacterized protein n=1 Tax=Edaphochlamys debaryana TaxID=47281 RepID=A0A835Y3M1_9CHLO|nr:hypothetical protein HYH03_006575 [Edaphochlamys debaryana]|eukprot:KAG2495303.1 hypothetical protein HYH03_006575 [Edaphochlamys debaryana]
MAALPLCAWRAGDAELAGSSNCDPSSTSSAIPADAAPPPPSPGLPLSARLRNSWTACAAQLPFSLVPTALAEAPAAAPAPSGAPPLGLAYRAGLLQPLLDFLPEGPVGRPSAAELGRLEAAALAGWEGPQPLQVVTLAWALAWAGHRPSAAYLERLQAAAASGSLPAGPGAAPHKLGPVQCAVLLWAAAMAGPLPAAAWDAGLRALASAAGGDGKGLDEVATLYLLHATMLYAAEGMADGARRAAAGGVAARSAGTRAAPASPASATAQPTSSQPRATREEVLAAAAALGKAGLLKRLGTAYGEFVPLHPAIEGPYMVLLYVLEQLAAEGRAEAAAAAAANGSGWSVWGGGGGATPAAAVEQWLPAGAAEAATALLASPKDLARLQRDLQYHWRGDTLVDEVQRARNQVIYHLTRRLGLTVAQPEDVDVVLPSRWLVLFVRPGPQRAQAGPSATATPGPAWASSSAAAAAGGRAGVAAVEDLAAAAGEVVEGLLRERFAPAVRAPPGNGVGGGGADGDVDGGAAGGRAAGGCAGGLWAARVRALRRLGWRVAVVDAGEWGALRSDAERDALLQALLRGSG